MANNFFKFRQFTIQQGRTAFKVGTDGVLLGACADLTGAGNILDIGTGTGLVAIMCAQRSDAVITAIEPDEDSYLQASENVAACRWASRIKVVKSGLQEFTYSFTRKFDVIISNPPYFRDSLINPEGRKAQTRHAFSLRSEELLSCSAQMLSDTGSLQVILPFGEGSLFIAEAGEFGLFCNSIIKIKPVPQGKIIRLIMKFGKTRRPVRESFLTVETGTRHHYTEQYKELTKDFYLKF